MLKSYSFAWRNFNKFCLSLGIPIFPVLINTIVAFLTHRFDHFGSKHYYIRSLLAGINFFNQLYQPTPSISLFSNHVIKLLLKGFANQCPALPDDHKPGQGLWSFKIERENNSLYFKGLARHTSLQLLLSLSQVPSLELVPSSLLWTPSSGGVHYSQ